MNKTDRIFYIIGLVLGCGLIAVVILRLTGAVVFTNLNLPCSFRMATGLYCPGCGGTHAIYDLLDGRFVDCFLDHAFVAYVALMYTIFLTWNTFISIWNRNKKAAHTKLPAMHFHVRYVYIGISLLLLQWIVKNVILLVF